MTLFCKHVLRVRLVPQESAHHVLRVNMLKEMETVNVLSVIQEPTPILLALLSAPLVG